MTPRQIERFFHILSRELDEPVTVILTGAAAGALWGYVRPSLDIDFAIIPRRATRTNWPKIEQAIERTSRLTGISVNYAEDIDRWSSVSLMDYQRHKRLYRRFGTLELCLMDPRYWSIGKVSRYLDPDVKDLVEVLTRQRVPATRLIRLWAKALRHSPRSPSLTQFRVQAEHFLRTYGRTIWGKTFDVEQTIRQFERAFRPTR